MQHSAGRIQFFDYTYNISLSLYIVSLRCDRAHAHAHSFKIGYSAPSTAGDCKIKKCISMLCSVEMRDEEIFGDQVQKKQKRKRWKKLQYEILMRMKT